MHWLWFAWFLRLFDVQVVKSFWLFRVEVVLRFPVVSGFQFVVGGSGCFAASVCLGVSSCSEGSGCFAASGCLRVSSCSWCSGCSGVEVFQRFEVFESLMLFRVPGC